MERRTGINQHMNTKWRFHLLRWQWQRGARVTVRWEISRSGKAGTGKETILVTSDNICYNQLIGCILEQSTLQPVESSEAPLQALHQSTLTGSLLTTSQLTYAGPRQYFLCVFFRFLSSTQISTGRFGSKERKKMWSKGLKERDLSSMRPTHLVSLNSVKQLVYLNSMFTTNVLKMQMKMLTRCKSREWKYEPWQLVFQCQPTLWSSQLYWLQRGRYNTQVIMDGYDIIRPTYFMSLPCCCVM